MEARIMKQYEKGNLYKMLIFNILHTISGSCLAILPVYFLRSGLSEIQISVYSSLAQTINLAISLSFAGITANMKDSRPAIAVILIIQALLTAGYALFCFFAFNTTAIFIIVLAIASIVAMASAVYTIFSYKLPCEIMEMESYSTYIAYSGLVCGIMGTLFSLLLPLLFQRYAYFPVAAFCIILSSVALILCAIVNLLLKPLAQGQQNVPVKQIHFNPINDFRDLISNREFRILFIPNILRGVGSGLLSVISLVAVQAFFMEDGDVPMITAAGNIGTFLASFLYLFLVKHIGIPKTGMVGGVIAGAICLAAFGNAYTFLAFYCIASVGLHLMGNAMPNMIYCSVDPSIMSRFHTWRLALLALGSAIGTPIYAALLGKVPVIVLFAISTAATILSVLGYYLLYRSKQIKS